MNTIGMDLKSCTLLVEDQPVRLQIWDTQGQEQFFALTRSYYRNCQGALVVFDLTDQRSLGSVQQYIQAFKEDAPEDAQDNIVLVGTKLDDAENRQISYEEAEAVCKKFNCTAYYETSASTGENVDESFFAVSSNAYQKTLQMESQNKTDDGSIAGFISADNAQSQQTRTRSIGIIPGSLNLDQKKQ